MTHVYDVMLITRGLEKKYCLTKCLHHIGEFCIKYISKVIIPMKHIYWLIIFNLCSKNV